MSHEGVRVKGHEAAFFTSVRLCAQRTGNHDTVVEYLCVFREKKTVSVLRFLHFISDDL